MPYSDTKLLITGCHRSGTSLLSVLVGSHPDIAIMNELKGDFTEIYKPITGVKIPIPTILLDKRGNNFDRFLAKKFNNKKRHVYGIAPYTIKDFLSSGKVLFIHRELKANIDSILKHTLQTRKEAEKDVYMADMILFYLQYHNYKNVRIISLYELTHHTEETLKGICKFLNVEYDEIMLEGYKLPKVYKNDRINPKK